MTEHAKFPVQDWQYEVSNGDTQLGYDAWVEAKIEADEEDEDSTTNFVNLSDAFQVVLDLARQNVIDDDEMPAEHSRQVEAINTVEDYTVNHIED